MIRPVMHFRRRYSYTFVALDRSGFLYMGMLFFFILVDVFALAFERGLELLPCCLVPWCRSGLQPLLDAGIFVVVGGGAYIVVARSPPRFCNLPMRGACLLALLRRHRALL